MDYVLTTTIWHFETLWTLSTPSLLYSVLDAHSHYTCVQLCTHLLLLYTRQANTTETLSLYLPCSHILSISRNKVSLWDDTLDFVIRRAGCSFIVADGDFVSVSLRKTAGENIYKDKVSYCWWKQSAKKWRNICGWSFRLSILKRWPLCDKAQWWSVAMMVHLLPAVPGISYAQLV